VHVAVYLPLLLPLLAVPAVRRVAERCHPRAATWVLTGTAVVASAASTVSLGLLAFAGAAQLSAVPAAVSVLAAVSLGVLVLALGRTGLAHLTALRDAYARADQHTGSELVVTHDDDCVAYALPGRPGRIVVSRGMLTVLDVHERRALLAHERTHLACRHHLFLTAAHLATALNPLLRPLRSALAYSVERWADETAACEVADRRVTARAVGKAALAARHAPQPQFVAMQATAGPVPRRVAALLAAPPSARLSTVGVVAAVAAAVLACSSLSSLEAAADLHESFEVTESAAHPGPHGVG
jgi:Zn-dependent protease with chaperone function